MLLKCPLRGRQRLLGRRYIVRNGIVFGEDRIWISSFHGYELPAKQITNKTVRRVMMGDFLIYFTTLKR